MVAKIIFVLILLVGIATAFVAIHALRNRPPPPRGSQSLPSQAAEGSGATPATSPARRTD